MATLILIPGAWHGRWCWEEVAPLLIAKNHHVLTPDLAGMGDDGTRWTGDILGQWTDMVAALVKAQTEPVVLVGHSRGGIIVSTVAERMPDHVALAVYLSAPLLQDGEAVAEVGFLTDEMLAAFVPNASGNAVSIDPLRASSLLYGDVAPAVAERAVARLTDEPVQPSTTRLSLNADSFGRVPRAYIETTEDRAVSLNKQREMQRRWPCTAVMSLPSGHSSFYVMPLRLAETLDHLAGRLPIDR